jgi:hypothetical protein
VGTTFDLGVIFRAIDKLSVPMAAMQKKLDAFSAKAKVIGKNMQDAGSKMTTFTTVPILAMGAAMVKTASDMEESINKVEVAFGASADNVKNWSKTTLKNFGIAQGTALDMAANFGDMSTSMGLSTSEAEKMSTSLVGLAGDMASFKNIGFDQAQTALTSIYTGETESLKLLGIVMTEANLEQFALSQGLSANLKKYSQAEKVQLRYRYVMQMSANSHGDFIRTGAGAANQSRIFAESLKELAANFGKILLPIFIKVITKVNQVIQWFGNLSDRTKKIILIVLALTAAVGPLVFIIGKVISIISMVGKAFQILRLILTPQGLIILGIVAAIIAIIIIIKNWGKISAWFKDKWMQLVDYIQRMPRIIFILIKLFAPFLFLPIMIIRNWDKIKNFFINLWTAIWNIFDNKVVQLIGSILMPFLGLPITIIKNWEGIANFFVNLWNGIVNAFVSAIDFIKKIWDSFMGWAMKNPVLKWLFETKPKKPENKNKQIEAQKEIDKNKEKPSLLNMDKYFQNFKKGKEEKSIVYVNVKVASEEGSRATIEQVKSNKNTKSKITNNMDNTGRSYL